MIAKLFISIVNADSSIVGSMQEWDPADADYPIPGNDDSVRSVQLIVSHIEEISYI